MTRAKWISFYDTEYRQVIGFLMKNGGPWEDAQDAAHEAFVSWDLMRTRPGSWQAITSQRESIRRVALRKYRRRRPGPRIRPQLWQAPKFPIFQHISRSPAS